MIGDRNNDRPAVASEETKILLASFLALRVQRGKKWCRKSGVGEFRRFLGEPIPDNVTPLASPRPRSPAEDDAIRNLKKVFAEHCKDCDRCKLARARGWGT